MPGIVVGSKGEHLVPVCRNGAEHLTPELDKGSRIAAHDRDPHERRPTLCSLSSHDSNMRMAQSWCWRFLLP